MITDPIPPVRTAFTIKKFENGNNSGNPAWILQNGSEFVYSVLPEGGKGSGEFVYVGWQEGTNASCEEILDHLQILLCGTDLNGEQIIRILHIACKILKQLNVFPDYLSEDDIQNQQQEQIKKKQSDLRPGQIFTIKPKYTLKMGES
jgi:hypothetical protein